MLTFLLSIIGFFVVFSFLVIIHEFGHFLVARWTKIPVLVFSVGFGKELIGFTDKKGTRWRFSLLPIGGYVKLYQEVETGDSGETDTYLLKEGEKGMQDAPAYQRLFVSLGGVIFNLLAAVIILWGLLWIQGRAIMLPVIGDVLVGSPAQKAGLKAKDQPLLINGQKISSLESFMQTVSNSPNKALQLTVLREGQEKILRVTPKEAPISETKEEKAGKAGKGRIGVHLSANVIYTRDLGLFSAFGASLKEVSYTFGAIFKQLGKLIGGSGNYKELGGVITIAEISGSALQHGLSTLLHWVALLSVNLAAINLFPLPVLDGGVALIALYEMVVRKKPPQRVMLFFNYIGLGLILLLMLVATGNDLGRLLSRFF